MDTNKSSKDWARFVGAHRIQSIPQWSEHFRLWIMDKHDKTQAEVKRLSKYLEQHEMLSWAESDFGLEDTGCFESFDESLYAELFTRQIELKQIKPVYRVVRRLSEGQMPDFGNAYILLWWERYSREAQYLWMNDVLNEKQ